VGLDFAFALRAFMRADPDIIVLGEVRDMETAKLVLRAAETGHLVLATLHTGSVRGAIGRMRALGVSDVDLRPLLRGVLVQRLVRTTCPACGGVGCDICLYTGYAGRTVVSECALFRNEIEAEKALMGEIWWPSMVSDAIDKINAGLTTAEEIYRVFQSEIENQSEDIKGMDELMAILKADRKKVASSRTVSKRRYKRDAAGFSPGASPLAPPTEHAPPPGIEDRSIGATEKIPAPEPTTPPADEDKTMVETPEPTHEDVADKEADYETLADADLEEMIRKQLSEFDEGTDESNKDDKDLS
ncbi:MAG: ATPase, T2SS/T4P/T4SS family, partial [Pseudomonadota bacterium]|nr:ATPase, T2SS/T4P/T4SS family [Pseudomonadota bacterium]